MLTEIYTIVVKVLENSASANEKQQLLCWIQASEENQRHFEEMVKVWEKTTMILVDEKEAEKRFALLEKKIRQRRGVSFFFRFAACIAALVVCSLLAKETFFNQQEITYLTITADNKQSIILPDSTLVWLNANSELKYPKTFSKQKREVYLVGEALFDVKREASRSFYVLTNEMKIEVLGTQFFVTDNQQSNESEIVLVSGKISLTVNDLVESLIVKPNQRVKCNYKDKSIDIQNVNVANYTNWTNDYLVFENTPLEDVLMQLEKWYNTSFSYENAALTRVPVSFIVDKESKEEVLSTLQLIVPFSYTELDGIVYISDML